MRFFIRFLCKIKRTCVYSIYSSNECGILFYVLHTVKRKREGEICRLQISKMKLNNSRRKLTWHIKLDIKLLWNIYSIYLYRVEGSRLLLEREKPRSIWQKL